MTYLITYSEIRILPGGERTQPVTKTETINMPIQQWLNSSGGYDDSRRLSVLYAYRLTKEEEDEYNEYLKKIFQRGG